jgi:hypothetical protein
LKRREEKEENNQKERSKNKRKKKKTKKNWGVWSRSGWGQGNSYFIASVVSVVQWKEKSFNVGGPSSIDFIYFWGSNKKQQCDGWGGARSAPFGIALISKRRVREAHGRARAAKTH